MQIVSAVESIVPLYEEQHGKHPSVRAIHFIEEICRTGEKLESLGGQHAEEGCYPMQSGDFQQLASGIEDPETAHNIAEYYQICYGDGYAQGRQRHD